ncbi:MAG: hypothetical protein HYZ53_13835 [Planctomycetes bacterium]|nr:hypothetical protein [Planctomycetota bacterium]
MTLTFASPLPVLLVALAGVAAIWAAVRFYRRIWRMKGAGRFPGLAVGLRAFAVLSLVLFLLRPVLSYDARNREDARILVLIDASRSMSVADGVGGVRRLDSALQVLTDPRSGILPALQDLAQVRLYAFGRDAIPVPSADLAKAGITPAAEVTDIREALQAAVKAEGAERVEAVLLLSDGLENGSASAQEAARSLGVRIHCVGVGGVAEKARDFRDLAVTRVDADRQVFLKNRVLVKAEVNCAGWEELSRRVQLRRGTEVLGESTVSLHPGPNEVRLSFCPTDSGSFEYEVRVEPMEGECLPENNSRYFVVTVSEDKVKLLCFESTLRWEYKFFRQVLVKDPTIAFAGLVKTNPDHLYVQGLSPGAAPAGGDAGAGLPASRAAWKKFDCVVLGDVGKEDFLPGQLESLRRYVAEDGGGLLVLGGRRSLSGEGLRNGPLAEALPVLLPADARELRGAFLPQLTPDGAAHPAVQSLAQAFGGGGFRLEQVFAVGAPRPGAQALLTVPGPGGEASPLLITQRFGTGRVALYATDSDWKWVLQAREKGGEECCALLWGQVVRWLANRQGVDPKEGAGLLLATDKDRYTLGDTVRVTARGPSVQEALRQKSTVTASIQAASGALNALAFEPAPGGYQAVFRPEAGGEFLLEATLLGASATRRVVVERNSREMDRLALDEELLRRLAGYSGGQYFSAPRAREIPALLSSAPRLGLARVEYGIDNSPALFLAFCLILTCEWIVRRRLQLV